MNSEILCITQSVNTEHPFYSIYSYFNSEFDTRLFCLDPQETKAETLKDISDITKMGVKTVITDSLQVLSCSKMTKTILYISSLDGHPFTEVNQDLRRQMHVYQNIDIFCASMWLAKLLYTNYQIKAKIQYPYVNCYDMANPVLIVYNQYNEIICMLENELDEDFHECGNSQDLSLAKLYIHIPSFDEAVNTRIPTASSLGVPNITVDRGCISEFVSQGDLLLPQQTNLKQWLRSVKEALRDRDGNSKMAKDHSKRYSNLDAIVDKIKLQANKRASAKLAKLSIAERSQTEERIAKIMADRSIKAVQKKKSNRSFPPIAKPLTKFSDYVYTRTDYVKPGEYEVSTPPWFKMSRADEFDISIIIPLFRSNEMVIQQIRNWDVMDDGITKEIIYVDDCCPDESAKAVMYAWDQFRNTWNGLQSIYGSDFREHIGRIISLSHNSGYATACNVGAKYAKGKYLLFLNADTTVTPNWLRPIVDAFHYDRAGIIGNMQLKQDGTIDSAGSEWLWDTRTFEHIGRNIYSGKRLTNVMRYTEAPQDLLRFSQREMVTGCCFAIPKQLFEEVGGFDVGYRIAYWEDSDLNLRVQEMGYKVYFQPDSIIYHKVGHAKASSHPFMVDNAKRFYERWVDNHKIDKYVKAPRPPGHI